MPTECLHLQFFDAQAVIQSDSPALLEFFNKMYHRFLAEEDRLQNIVEYGLYTRIDNPWGKPVLVLAGEVLPLDDAGVLEAYAYDGILNSILARVKSHYLIHAAALSWENRGLIMVADAGQGKTTLTLELVRRGYKFLSDELAAIRRLDGRLDAFPRRLRVRPETLELLDFRQIADQVPVVFGKYLVDIDDFLPGSLVQSAMPRYLFLMDHQGNEDVDKSNISEGEFVVYVDHIDEDLLSAIGKIPEVIHTQSGSQSGFPIINIVAAQKGQAILAVERICADQGVHILEISKRLLTPPSFQRQASIESISQSQAVMGLLRQFMPGHHSALIKEEFAGRSTRLFIELARSLEQIQCYRIRLGSLNQTADLICELICR
jgi:hypothetical protein